MNIIKKIVITGGHLTPALAVISCLDKQKWQVIYIGRRYALEGDQIESEEMRHIVAKQIGFIPLTTGRIQRTFTVYTLWSLLKIPIGLVQSFFILSKIKPSIILSFGGYIAVPVVIAAKCLHIPVVTHEQTLVPGLANKLINRLADKICLGWSSTRKYFPADKTVYTGNPLRREIFIKKSLPLKKDRPVLYITGGNLGAHSINQVIAQILPELLSDYIVIHQTGSAYRHQDFQTLTKLKQKLPKRLQSRYLLYQYVNSQDIGWVLNQADVIIGRSGANIVSEVVALQKLAIFIPLPWAGQNEQELNADLLVDRQAAYKINQSHLTKEILLITIKKALMNKNKTYQHLSRMKTLLVADADKRIVGVLESLV